MRFFTPSPSGLSAAQLEGERLGFQLSDGTVAVDERRMLAGSAASSRLACNGLLKTRPLHRIGVSAAKARSRIGEAADRKLAGDADTGSTEGAVIFARVALPARPIGKRLTHGHRSSPGLLGHVKQASAKGGVNIAGPDLQMDGEIGQVVVGAMHDSEAILAVRRALPQTICARLLCERE